MVRALFCPVVEKFTPKANEPVDKVNAIRMQKANYNYSI